MRDALAGQQQVQAQFQEARAGIANWRDPLVLDDARTGLTLAREKEGAALKFLSGAWRSLKKTVESRYDFAAHAVRPTVVSVLESLLAFYAAESALAQARVEAEQAYGNSDLEAVLATLRPVHELASGPVAELRDRIASGSTRDLASLAPVVRDAGAAIRALFDAGSDRALDDLQLRAERLRGSAGSMTELLADLRIVSATPAVAEAIRSVPLSPDAMELAVLEQAIAYYAETNADVERFTGYELELHLAALRSDMQKLLDLNAQLIRALRASELPCPRCHFRHERNAVDR